MVKKSKLQPVKIDSFQELFEFWKVISGVCKKLNITPIVYGGLAYFYYTQDKSTVVNDLDLLVPEDSFQNLIKLFNKQDEFTYKKMPYHSIEVFKNDLKIDIDSIEYFLDPRSREVSQVQIRGLEFHILNIESLIDVYEEAIDNMPKIKKLDKKRDLYKKKLNNLKKIL